MNTRKFKNKIIKKKHSKTDLIPTHFYIIPIYVTDGKSSNTSLTLPFGRNMYMTLIKAYEYLRLCG